MKIGIGIITCNRPEFLKKLWATIPDYIDDIAIVNDGNKIDNIEGAHIINNTQKLQVGGSKNVAMKYLLNQGCDYIFTLEDDILIEDPTVFLQYIEAYKSTGICHFNFGFSNLENLDASLQPVYKKVIEYPNGTKIVLTPNVLGAFTFYTRNALMEIGLHNRIFNKGHGDHPELTYRAYKYGYTTPFWWFADIYNSWNMIKNQSNMSSDSTIRNNNFWESFNEANDAFKQLHGYKMTEVPDIGEEKVYEILKQLKKKNGHER